ncbi:MAG: hypothetical protein Q9160_008172 [Pyrenula sp. 1 TL-2023]
MGCICCCLFEKAIEFAERKWGHSQRNPRLIVECGRLQQRDENAGMEEGVWMMLCFELHSSGESSRYEIYEPSRGHLSFLSGVRSKRSDVPSRASNPRCFRQLKTWLDTCDREHGGSCARPPSALFGISGYRPARLLHIQTDEKGTPARVKLVDTPHRFDLRYCTLSYCWGDAKFVTSTIETYQSHYREGISMEMLPQTYQDAITITNSIGVHYIWIDSLCIIQSFANDWETEITKMAAIFEGSYLTIAAGSSTNAHAGFLVDPLRQGHIIAGADSESCDAKGKASFHIRQPISHSEDADEARLHPIRRRGWCLQELTLAKRVIFYKVSELVWKCRGKSSCECGELDYKDQDPPVNEQRQEEVETREQRLLGGKWLRTVTDYMTMQLTDQSDIFPAIEGLARRMHHDRLGRYLAGLWEADLVYGLLWEPKDKGVRQPIAYQAPSWSWASVVGPVSWDFDFHTGISESTAAATMVDAELTATNRDDMFGRLKKGSITLRGALIRGTFEWKRLFPELPLYERKERGDFFCWLRLDGGDVVLEVDLDELKEGNYDKWNATVGKPFYSLRLLTRAPRTTEDWKMTAYGLILRKVESKPELYRRVGWHGASPNEVYEDVAEQEVKII